MKLLIDECVDERLRYLFAGHDCHTAHYAGPAGLEEWASADAAETSGFDVPITVDQNIPEQQNLSARRISILILRGPTNRIRDLASLVPAAIAALTTICPGQVVRIPQ